MLILSPSVRVRFLIALFYIAVGVWCLTGKVMAQGLLCGETAKVEKDLKERYGETLVAVGVMGAGKHAARLFVSPEKRTWTLTMVRANGTSCLYATGEDFNFVKPGKSDKETGLPIRRTADDKPAPEPQFGSLLLTLDRLNETLERLQQWLDEPPPDEYEPEPRIVYIAEAEGWGGLTNQLAPPLFDDCIPVLGPHGIVQQQCARSFGAQGSIRITVPVKPKDVRT